MPGARQRCGSEDDVADMSAGEVAFRGEPIQVGEIEAAFVEHVSKGAANWPIPIGLKGREYLLHVVRRV